jgi:hypothetical protein
MNYTEEHREANKKYYEKNRNEKLAQFKKYYQENKAKLLEKRAEKRQTEEYKQYVKNYIVSDTGKKSRRIAGWKQLGVISNDYEALYNKWKDTSHCEECNVELIAGNGKNKKCLDHNHKTGVFRNIVCNRCNIKRGFIDRL